MLRSFRDSEGVSWQVWAVLPVSIEHHRIRDPATGADRLPLPPELASGWMAFQSARGERRRIGPLPDGWEDLDDAALLAALQRAAVAPGPIETGPSGVERVVPRSAGGSDDLSGRPHAPPHGP